jgi:hypothetical protein
MRCPTDVRCHDVHCSRPRSFDWRLFGQSLLREHIGSARRTVLGAGVDRAERTVGSGPVPRSTTRATDPPTSRLRAVQQQRGAQPAVEGPDTNLAIGPVIHGIRTHSHFRGFQATEHALDMWLTAIARKNLFSYSVSSPRMVSRTSGQNALMQKSRGERRN